ncbi:MAG: 4-hydroxy-tetrahydrodipicolinate synthase [Candidatus Diapherotrites archaeon]
MAKKLKGCFPALVTPMREDGDRLNHAINYDAFKQLIDYVLAGGVTGIVPSGCTGHACVLTTDEQIELIKFARENAPEKIPVIAGDGSNCTREAISLAKKISDVGITTHLQISPYQNKPTQEGLYQHYAAIANAMDDEIIVYNVPGRTGKNIEAETTVRLAKEFSNIIAIKEASGNMEQIKSIIDQTTDLDFTVVSGDDGLNLEIMKAGGTGGISVAANSDPKRTSAVFNLALEGNMEEAEKVDGELRDLYKAIFIETNPCPTHYILKKIGIPVGTPRLPLVDITEESEKQIDPVIQALGLRG